jgi:predicted oxidoreductase (fatty acid repression mutant protein)
MKRTLKEALEHRRSYYALSNELTVAEEELKSMIETALLHVPSAFNSQTARIVLLTKENHKKLWNITKAILKKILPEESFLQTEGKIDNCFASGYGTILFYEDTSIVKKLQESFPTYSDRFPVWSEHTSAMHQLAIWTMIEDAGMGASLQHYNPLIDDEVAAQWKINPEWKLIAQMPFGKPVQEPEEKKRQPLASRFLIF